MSNAKSFADFHAALRISVGVGIGAAMASAGRCLFYKCPPEELFLAIVVGFLAGMFIFLVTLLIGLGLIKFFKKGDRGDTT